MKAFLTGATGYIGGEALFQLSKVTPPVDITVLVRNKGKNIPNLTAAFPNVRIVQGDLDDADIIEAECQSADIVLHLAATNHVVSAQAIQRGLTSTARKTPGHWVQMSGASVYSTRDIAQGSYGDGSDETFDDVKDSARIIAKDGTRVKTALIFGPLIYGTGRGSGNTTSIQAPAIARYTLQRGEGFRLGAGKSTWSNIHIRDLGALIVKLVEAARDGKDGCWNANGLFHSAAGSLSFGELGRLIAEECHARGYIKSAEITAVVDPADGDVIMPHASVLLGTNAVTLASRAKQSLGWHPDEESLASTIPEVVAAEVEHQKR